MDNIIQIVHVYQNKAFQIDIPSKMICKYLYNNCPSSTDKKTGMRKFFRSTILEDSTIIVQEELLPQCMKCCGFFQKM